MRYLVDGWEMKGMDRHSIETIGIPSIVLMERAASAVVQELKGCLKGQPSILIVCGTGNNGADGLAIARMLQMQGYSVRAVIVGNEEHTTAEWKIQYRICENLDIPMSHELLIPEYIISNHIDVIVDALLGTGLSRMVKDQHQNAMEIINCSQKYVVSVDIPSGISADTGAVLGAAVKADLTVTFQYEKLGMVLYPGREHCGTVSVMDIGIAPESRMAVNPKAFTLEKDDLKAMPERPAYSNKGTFGKVLVIAGAKNMSGAAYLSALAAYRSGAGLVRIFTVEENREILQTGLPEAILTTYRSGEFLLERLQEICEWADAIVMGPGLGVNPDTTRLLNYVLQYSNVPMVLDADALNTIGERPELMELFRAGLVLTPHLKEMSRLTGMPVSNIAIDLPEAAKTFSDKYGVTLVLKDARTLVADGKNRLYVNTCGNSGMATGGSGDVLSGIIGGLLAGGMREPFEAAAYGVFLHGMAGDAAAADLGERAVMARDIVRRIP